LRRSTRNFHSGGTSMKARYIIALMLAGIAFGGWLALAHAAAAAPRLTPGAGEPTLEEVRRATDRFRDVKTALAEGYIRDPFDLCDSAAMMGRPESLGAMGIHFLPSRSARHLQAAVAASDRRGDAHRFSQAGDPDLRAAA
jgi:hypothetical protein